MQRLFYLLMLFSLKLQAQVILIPSRDMNLENYMVRCRAEGYQCTQDYLKNSLTSKKSQAFENFIETLDLYSEDYRQTLVIKVKNLLAEENLDLEQIGLLIKIITRFESLDKSSVLSQIKSELKDLSFDVQNIFEEKSDSESYMLFHKFLTRTQYLNLKYKQKYTRAIKITPFTEPMDATKNRATYLIQGKCDQYQFSSLFKDRTNVKYTAAFEDHCGNSQVYNEPTTSSNMKWKDYEKPLIYVAATAVAIGLLSQYQFKVTF